jgi:catechol 2,3-dioxygenase
MPIQRVGHVVIKMRDLDKAREFYEGVLGMTVSSETSIGLFFHFGDYHHDIAVFKTSPDAELPKRDQVGLVHIAVVADSLETVKQIYERCKEKGVPIDNTTDHGFTKSLYIRDPEGNAIEVYVEVPEYNWHGTDFAQSRRPLDLESVPATV